jgi:hypothetical protein
VEEGRVRHTEQKEQPTVDEGRKGENLGLLKKKRNGNDD